MGTFVLPDYTVRDKVAIVTGSTRGIGYSTARILAENGAKVVITGRNQAACDEQAKSINNAVGIAADISTDSGRRHLIDATVEAFHRIDILVNNAGIGGQPSKVTDVTEETLDKYIAADYKAVYFLSAEIIKQMIRQGCEKGTHPYRIINLSSAAAFKCPIGDTAYGSLKAAVTHLTKIMANEAARYGITVNAVAPGYVITDMTKDVMENEKNAEAVKRMISLRRYSEPWEIGGVINFLASPAAGYITGAVINVDGGMTLN